MKRKPLAEGVFVQDIYMARGRFPIDFGDCLTKEEILDMFEKTWDKGTKVYLWNDGDSKNPCLAWYLEDFDGGWNADSNWSKKNIKRISKEKVNA